MNASGNTHRRAPGDSRQGLNTQFSGGSPGQSVYSRSRATDLNDAVRVSADPTFRLIGSPSRWDRGAALTSTLHWFETDLTGGENGLMAVSRELLDGGRPGRSTWIRARARCMGRRKGAPTTGASVTTSPMSSVASSSTSLRINTNVCLSGVASRRPGCHSVRQGSSLSRLKRS